jgi:hypothetical protein
VGILHALLYPAIAGGALALWYMVTRTKTPERGSQRDPLYAAHLDADGALQVVGHDVGWTRENPDAVRGTCGKCGGVLTLAYDGRGVVSTVYGMMADPGGGIAACPVRRLP